LAYFAVSCFAADNNKITELIDRYTRPLTFLAVIPYDSEKFIDDLAQMYDEHVFVLWGQQHNLVKRELPSNYVRLNARTTVESLKHISECEHFDIVFVQDNQCELNREYASVLYNLGEHVFVRVKAEEKAFAQHLVVSNFRHLENYSDGSLLFFCSHPITFLKRTQWLEFASDANFVRHIHSTYTEKTLHKNYGTDPTSSLWIPGINLMTFKMLDGRTPCSFRLRTEINKLFTTPHSDWMPNNMVIQGDLLALIDYEDPLATEPKTVQDKGMLDLMIQFATEYTPERIPTLFKEILTYCFQKIHTLRK
jgi:hypothetical protein